MLLEEELVVLDLQVPGWPVLPAPYLAPLHSSAITCAAHVANVPAKLWARIVSAGEQQSAPPAAGASVCARAAPRRPPGGGCPCERCSQCRAGGGMCRCTLGSEAVWVLGVSQGKREENLS